MRLGRVCGLGVLWLFSGRQAFGQSAQEIGVPAANKLELHNVKAGKVSYQGRAAVRVTDAAAADVDDAGRLAIIPGTSFQDGTIEVNLSGDTLADAPAQARGFVGIAFRVSADQITFRVLLSSPQERAVRKTSCNEAIPRNTSRCRDSRGTNCARKVPGSMNRSRSGGWAVDKSEDSGVGNERAAVRERSGAADADCERPESSRR